MTRSTLFSIVWAFAGVVITTGLGQPLPPAPKGFVIYKDPQTRYVEAFEYLSSAPVNAYVTGYVLPGGINRQVHDSGILKTIEFPVPGSCILTAAQIQGILTDLDTLSKQYPQYATLLGDASAHLRAAPVATQQASKPPQPLSKATTAPAPAQRLSAPIESASAATTTLTLKSGVQFREVKIMRTADDGFTVRHQTGVIDVLFSDLPNDPDGLPPEVRTLLKNHQDRLAAVAAEKARASAETEKARLAVETEKQRVAAETEKARLAVETEKQQPATTVTLPAPAASPVALITDVSALPSTTSTASSPGSGWRNSVLSGLMIKGLLIGMDGTEAAKTLLEQGDGKLGLITTTVPNETGYDVCRVSNGHRVSQGIGHLRFDPQDGTLTRFVFYGSLSDLLFNTADQGAEEFAQTFINAYGVPTMKPTAVGGHRCWACDSPRGWTLRIFTDKTIEVLRTPARTFD